MKGAILKSEVTLSSFWSQSPVALHGALNGLSVMVTPVFFGLFFLIHF